VTDVKGRTAFITGGANGIGLGIARSFARAGAKLALADIDVAALARAKDELGQITQVETYQLDVRDRDAFAKVAESIESVMGPVTLLFNNAGVAAGAPPAALTFDLWDFGIGINLYGVINGIQTFLPKMIASGQGGHIVNTASGAGLAAVTTTLYTTAKFAVVGMSESLNNELKPANIGVSVLCPGTVATDIVNRTASAAPASERKLTETQQAKVKEALARATANLMAGAKIDDVGDMVLKGVQENSLYIHTDRMMEIPIKMRSRAILDSLPNA